MSSGTVPAVKRRRLDRYSTAQQPQQNWVRPIANGNSRNNYGNIYHGPVSYAGAPAVGSETDDIPTAERLLEALNFDEREDRLATIGQAHEETCQWLFEKDDYKAWRDPDKRRTHHGFFWIKGKPGTGKSTLMKCAYHRGLKEFPDDVIVSFFFNARGAKLQKSTEGMYRSLLCQLLEQMPHLAARLPPRKYERLQKPGWPIETLEDVLREALLLVDSARLTCYVDALDECQEQDARQMIDFFDLLATSAAASNLSMHILLSSRHYPQIDISRCQQLILEQQPDHGSDIAKYIQSKLQIGSSPTALDIKSTLLQKASGVFLWVVLVVQILNEHKRRGLFHELKQRVNDIPKDLDKLFAEILQGGSSEVPYTFSMLQLIAFASRPLTREEVYHAVLYSDAQHSTTSLIDVTQEDMEHFIVNCSKGLAEMTKGMCPTVQLIHESVRNHLLDTGLKTVVPASCDNLPAWCHENLEALCLEYLKKCALVLLQLPDDGQKEHLSDHFMDIIELKRQTSTTHPFLDYALDGVIIHAQQAHCAGRPQHAHMRTFPLDIWTRLHNMIVASHNVRLSRRATLVYILVTKGAFQLVELIVDDASWRPDTGNLASTERHRTLLGAATDRGDYEMVNKLLALGVSPSSDAKDEQSCLSLAIGKGDVKICRRLMDAGAKITNMSTRIRYGTSDLRLAIDSGCLEIVQALVQHPHYARHLISTFEADLKYAIRRYAESACSYEELIPLLNEALERQGGSDPRSPSSKAGTQAIHTAVLRAACQRPDMAVIHWFIDQGIVIDLDVLTTCLFAGNLDIIHLLLEARADVRPWLPEPALELDCRASKFIQLLLDQAHNAIDPFIEAVYPHFSRVKAPRFQHAPSEATYPTPKPSYMYMNPRDKRFARVFPLVVYHGCTWNSVLKCLLDRRLHISNRQDYMDTALLSACHNRDGETLQTLLDWCEESPLKHKLLPGLGHGLVVVAHVSSWNNDFYTRGKLLIQQIWDSGLEVTADAFYEAYHELKVSSNSAIGPVGCQQILLQWGVERTGLDIVFAIELGFFPTGGTDDQHRLREHLRSRHSLRPHAANPHAMIRPVKM